MAEETAIIQHDCEIVDPFGILIDGNHMNLELDDFMDAYKQVCSDNEEANQENDFSGSYNGEYGGDGVDYSNVPPQNTATGNPIQTQDWPIQPVPISCSCCETLRQIVHFNGLFIVSMCDLFMSCCIHFLRLTFCNLVCMKILMFKSLKSMDELE